MCVIFFCPSAVNEAASSFGWVLLSAFHATQGGNVFEAQVSIPPYWGKPTR